MLVSTFYNTRRSGINLTVAINLGWLRCTLCFSLLRSTIQCFRGDRSSKGRLEFHLPVDVVQSEYRFYAWLPSRSAYFFLFLFFFPFCLSLFRWQIISARSCHVCLTFMHHLLLACLLIPCMLHYVSSWITMVIIGKNPIDNITTSTC